MSITVEKNVPVPAGRTGYPFAAMEIGDSFAVTGEDPKKKSIAVSSAARAYTRTNPGASFSTRRVTENGTEVVRCWRVAPRAAK